jgi:hypothetical protein
MPENDDFLTTTPQTRLRTQPLTIATLSAIMQPVLTPTTMPYLLCTTSTNNYSINFYHAMHPHIHPSPALKIDTTAKYQLTQPHSIFHPTTGSTTLRNGLSWQSQPPPAPQADTPLHRRTITTMKSVLPPAPLTKQGIVISKIETQNAHGLRSRPRDSNGKTLPYDPHDYTRYEHLIATTKLKQLDIYFVQETWPKGNVFDEVIIGYNVFCHNEEKGNHNFHQRRAELMVNNT